MMTLDSLIQDFIKVRIHTEAICKPLENEDYSVQPSDDVSPPKWHLAHSTWFWEQFVLVPFVEDYKIFNDDFAFLFNSYYNNVGKRVLRPNRGLMTRPTVKEVYEYRSYVSLAVLKFLENHPNEEAFPIIEIGLNHEEQHQELLAYDIKYILGHQPLFPEYPGDFVFEPQTTNTNFIKIKEGIYNIGHNGNDFCFDNELGFHKIYSQEFEIADKVITNAEYIDFIEDGGYSNFNLWHADGWDFVSNNKITAPLYWYKIENEWYHYNYNGLVKLDKKLPLAHVSFYEAYAFAEWKGMRLPTEFEWEIASSQLDYGQVWEWTNSAYLPYPNFKKAPGALGEYNGKFMVNQHVLRGASIATPLNHSRITYRNFFHPSARWIFSGIRLVK